MRNGGLEITPAGSRDGCPGMLGRHAHRHARPRAIRNTKAGKPERTGLGLANTPIEALGDLAQSKGLLGRERI